MDGAAAQIRLSLIVSTIGHTNALARLLDSLDSVPEICDTELLLIDQSPGLVCHRLVALRPPQCQVTLLTSARGLSIGRNVGLAHARGDIVAFPDDDCEYLSDTVTTALAVLDARRDLVGVAGRQLTPEGHSSALRWLPHASVVTHANFYRTTISSTLFLRREAVLEAGGFDEEMGVGAATPWLAGEESDLVLRLVRGGVLAYEPSIVVFHGDVRLRPSGDYVSKMRGYGRGHGYLWRKHRLSFHRQSILLLRKLGRAAISTASCRWILARADRAYIVGVVEGYRGRLVTPLAVARATPVEELRRSYRLRIVIASLGLVAAFLTTILVVRSLSPRGASTYFGALAALFIGPLIGRLGLGQSAIRELSHDDNDSRDKSVVGRSIWATGGLSLCSAPAVAWLSTLGLTHQPGRLLAVFLIAVSILLEAIRLTASDIFSGLGQVRWSVFTTHHVRSVVVACVFGLYLVIEDRPTLEALLIIHVGVGFVLVVAALLNLSRHAHIGAPSGGLRALQASIVDGAVLSAADLVGFVIGRGDVWLASFAFGPLDATRYSTASVLAFQLTVPVGLASTALAPTVSRLWKAHERDRLERLLNSVATLSTAFTGLLVAILWFTAAPLLGRLYGANMRPAAILLQLLATGSLIVAALGASSMLMIMTGHGRQAALSALCSVLLVIPAGLAAIAYGGPLTLAAASAIASPVLFVGQWWCARRMLGFAPTPGLSLRKALAGLRSDTSAGAPVRNVAT